MGHIETMPTVILQTSDLKKRAGKVLDAVRRAPQFVIRNGHLFLITLTELPVGQNPAPGFFADAYPLTADRAALESAAGRVRQIPER